MATYLAHDALRLPAASMLANSGLCVNIEIKIWLLLGVNAANAKKNKIWSRFNSILHCQKVLGLLVSCIVILCVECCSY